MNKIVKKIVLRLLYHKNFLMHIIYKNKSIVVAKLFGREYHIGNGVKFIVPVHVNGKGTVIIGDNVGMGYTLAIKAGRGDILLQARRKNSKILIGKNSYFSNNVSIIACENVTIGENCLIGEGVTIYDSDFHDTNPLKRHMGKGLSKSVILHDNVWVGSRALIQKGISIGENSIIAPMSVVTKTIPENSVAAGVPAVVINKLI